VVNPATDIEDRVHAADKFEKTFLQMGDRTALNESWKQVKKYVSPDNYCSWIKTWF
jgi:hypothetical protein